MNITDKEFLRLATYMQEHYGINLSKKRTLIEGRLGQHVEKRYRSFDEYIDHVLEDNSGEELSFLVSRLTTNFTYFMRERTHYDYLTSIILPEIEKNSTDKDLRIWSAGCSTGEEAYTTMMVVDEYFGSRKAGWDTTILATDISSNVLRIAKTAKYDPEALRQLDPQWKEKYFSPTPDGMFKIKEPYIKEVYFNHFNLMQERLPFKKKFHVIFCRNVMIYFDTPTKEKLCKRYYDALVPGGHLFIGLSETLSNVETKLQFISPAIYRKGT